MLPPAWRESSPTAIFFRHKSVFIRCDYGRQGSCTSREDIEMEPIKFTLCPLCTECPGVEITDEGVRIGEDANTVRLSCRME